MNDNECANRDRCHALCRPSWWCYVKRVVFSAAQARDDRYKRELETPHVAGKSEMEVR